MGIAVASVPAPLHLHFSPLSHTKTRQLRLVRPRNLKTSPSKPLNYLLSFSTLFSASATEEGPPPLSLPEDSLDVQSNTEQLPLRGCEACGREEVERGCNGEGRIQGGIATIPGFGWWPIKAYRPCPGFLASGGRYKRQGQNMDEVISGRGKRTASKKTDDIKVESG